jgi:uncharacterized membrane protein
MTIEEHKQESIRFLNSEEGTIFITGASMLIVWIASVAVLWHIESTYWLNLLTMGFAALAGRAASIAQGTSIGFNPGLVAALAIYFDVLLLFITYPLLIYSYRHFLENRFFKEHMQPVFDSAKKNLTQFRKAKIASVFLFVWFPFWMTGIIGGSILGYLLGLRTWVTLLTVILGSTSSVVCWVYITDKLFTCFFACAFVARAVPLRHTGTL